MHSHKQEYSKMSKSQSNSSNSKKNTAEFELRYLNRLFYYGKITNLDSVEGALIITLKCYTASRYFGGYNNVRIYVPSDLENDIIREVTIGDDYFAICAPYRVTFKMTYRHRVDLLLQLFKAVN